MIIGNCGWTKNACDVCDRQFSALIRIGDEPDYDARWQDLCVDCLTSALETLKAAL